MTLERIHTIDDLRTRASARVPKVFFDYIDGGAGLEWALERNRSAWRDIILVPRTMRDVSERVMKTRLFGRDYDAPIGISPVGLANLAWPKTDLRLARLAAEKNIPYTLSTVGSTSIEAIAGVAPENLWFQLYVPNEDEVLVDLLKRVDNAGVKVLAVTVDVAVPGSRYRDLRNGFTMPFRPSFRTLFDIIRHPAWVAGTLRDGSPDFETLKKYDGGVKGSKSFSRFVTGHLTRNMDIKRMTKIRKLWPHTLVIKGILSPEDGDIAVQIGADGVIVSNHGARQLDSVASPIEALPGIVERVGGKLVIMLDSGIRTGSDIVKAYCLGADFVFAGRPFLFGSAAAGAMGVERAFDILTQETSTTLALIGCNDIARLDRSYLG